MTSPRNNPVRTGADILLSEAGELIGGKTIGILTNHTGRLSDGRHLVDAIAASGRVRVAALFGPEHGIGGTTPDGGVVEHSQHEGYSIPIYSLYGKLQKPTPAMLSGLDALVCDIQDIGARFYTFISTIALAMEAAAEQRVRVIVLDRPNPIRGLDVDGPIRREQLKSIVGWMPIPITHGMTIGELARLWNEERWLTGGVQAVLHVVGLQNWRRSQWYDETGLPWIPPSPNMTRLETAIIYPGLCLIEGTTLSEGRGTSSPFELIGAPWVDPDRVLKEIERLPHDGVSFEAATFIPRAIPGVTSAPKFEGEICQGVRISVVDRNKVLPVRLGISVLTAFLRMHPREMELQHPRFDLLSGDSYVGQMLEEGADPEDIAGRWKPDLARFGEVRGRYLLY
jgi:uncharacterized protein YbbC (DUF1343 family)